jgi:hypothetical protein
MWVQRQAGKTQEISIFRFDPEQAETYHQDLLLK